MNYDIAFSYASEQKDIVNTYKKTLVKLGLNVFIDTEHKEKFVFKYVPDEIKKIYDDKNIVMIIFLSKEYVEKNYTKYEGHIASDRLIAEKRLGVIRLDNATLDWLPSSLHYFDNRRETVDDICKSLYVSIKSNSLVSLSCFFSNVVEFIIENSKNFSRKYISENCIIFSVNSNKKSYIKIKYDEICERILFLFSSTHTDDFIFPIAEINKKGDSFVFINKGISDSKCLISKYVSERQLSKDFLLCLNKYLENI